MCWSKGVQFQLFHRVIRKKHPTVDFIVVHFLMMLILVLSVLRIKSQLELEKLWWLRTAWTMVIGFDFLWNLQTSQQQWNFKFCFTRSHESSIIIEKVSIKGLASNFYSKSWFYSQHTWPIQKFLKTVQFYQTSGMLLKWNKSAITYEIYHF